jgi:hypothetical protein
MFKNLKIVILILTVISISSCEVFDEQNVSYDSSMISLVAYFSAADTCYLSEDDDDFSESTVLFEKYIFKILTEDTMIVCCKQVNQSAMPDTSFISGQTINIHASNTFTEPGQIPLSTPISSATDNSIEFDILGSGICSEVDAISNYMKVGILYMRSHRNKKYIMVTDPCGKVAGVAVNPYMQ